MPAGRSANPLGAGRSYQAIISGTCPIFQASAWFHDGDMLRVRFFSTQRPRKELRPFRSRILFFALSCIALKSVAQQIGLHSYRTPAYVEFTNPRYIVAADETNVVISVLRTGEFRELCAVHFS